MLSGLTVCISGVVLVEARAQPALLVERKLVLIGSIPLLLTETSREHGRFVEATGSRLSLIRTMPHSFACAQLA
jgi:hypothetical protein